MGENATDRLFERITEDLRPRAQALMRQERNNHTLETNALIGEAYLRLRSDPSLRDMRVEQFLGCVVRAMRRILVEHARRKGAQKRGGGRPVAELVESLERGRLDPDFAIEIDDFLKVRAAKGVAEARQVRVFELHVYAGQALETIGMLLGISRATAYDDWSRIREALRVEFRDA